MEMKFRMVWTGKTAAGSPAWPVSAGVPGTDAALLLLHESVQQKRIEIFRHGCLIAGGSFSSNFTEIVPLMMFSV